MKISSLVFPVLLAAGLIPGLPSAESHTHSHTHAEPAKTMYTDPLPKADHFKDLKGPVQVEQTVDTKILDENGKQVGTKRFNANVSQDKASTKASTGSQKVRVLAVADAEYRAKYSDWQTRIVQIVEQADVAFNRDHNIDFVVQAVQAWNSSGSNSSQILSNLQGSFRNQNYHFVVGFTAKSSFDAGGIAYVYNGKPSGPAFSVNLDQGTANTAKAAQHEFSHNFGLQHDAQGSGIRCVMNYDYAYSVDIWDSSHNRQIATNKAWYK
ncbi:zinc-dependent metalloprotease [Bacillus velezensis]|uniref:zinc-dependent metalloprotease n=1 Tax=Bacillus velezensis TaxID=492670 RepID=UPI000744C514|nr:zinc-dependent metalloprotease [Bacillus velezensis]QGT57230.1 peptidase M84 [Bacillus velezensis]CUX94870.1 Zinc metalloproteinase [Bacillus velezensis]